MDLSNIGKAEDRISELPDPLLHRILSFLDTKQVARTSVLSKRWSHIWTSIPTLVFPDLYHTSEINKFMDFVDTTLRLRDASSNIQKIHIYMNDHFNASKVHSWISNITERNVEELNLWLNQTEPFLIPLSLFTCESLVTLELTASFIPLSIPKSFSLPKLKSLTLCGFHFIDDCWNEQHISNCPVLENLILDSNWFGVRNFCISTPALKYLEIDRGVIVGDDGLQSCALKINAPNLASLTYRGCVAKEYVLSSFQSLESANIWLSDLYVPVEQKIGAAVSKFFQALTHVKSLTIYDVTLQTISSVDDFVNILPIFHNLETLFLELEETTDKSAFPLLKAAHNLTHLIFNEHIRDNVEEDSWDGLMLTKGCLFQHLRYVSFMCFRGNAREMRWSKLILKNAEDLQTITYRSCINSVVAKCKEVHMSELPSHPIALIGAMESLGAKKGKIVHLEQKWHKGRFSGELHFELAKDMRRRREE